MGSTILINIRDANVRCETEKLGLAAKTEISLLF